MPTTRGQSHAFIGNSRIRPVASTVSASMERSAPLATALKLSATGATGRGFADVVGAPGLEVLFSRGIPDGDAWRR